MKKVTWDAGHGKNRPDKRTPDGQAEWTFNDAVVRAGMNYLANYEGVAQLRLDDPSGVRDVPLKERTDRAKAWGSNLHVSAHHNVLNTFWVDAERGVETFAMKDSKHYAESLKLANIVHPKYVKAMGLKDRGIKSDNLHMLREVGCTAILTEGGFMDSRKDVAAMRNDAKLKAQGEAIAQGVVEYFGLQKKESAKVEIIKLSSGQQNAKDKLVKHGMMAANFDFPNDATGQATLTMVTILAPLLDKLEKKGSL